jgi:predicted GH43/DUF377 family glycosyl hydrolase
MKFDVSGKETEVFETSPYISMKNDLRGGSQVIPFNDGYLTLSHETDLYQSEQNKKDATYRHRFVYWDRNFKLQKISKLFSFMNAKIEFCCGMVEHNNNLLITFGVQDNASYILKVSKSLVESFINE